MNYYEILEVSPNASPVVIKAAYKSLMQRYHPDRNPGNAATAERASLVVQAYEVLSDSNRRAAYDINLKQQSAGHLNSILDKSRNVPLHTDSVVKDSRTYWFLWLLIALILSSGWLILSLSEKKQSPESELKEIRLSLESKQLTQDQAQAKFKRIDEIFREHPEILIKEKSQRAKDAAARTIPVFISNLSVNLRAPDNSPGDSGHVLTIPALGAIVGTFDAEKVILYLENNKELIIQELAEKLAYAKHDELIKINGEEYLKKIILDSIGDTTGTNRFEDYPSSNLESPGRYGVIEVLLPESYSVD